MADPATATQLSAEEHAKGMVDYFRDGTKRALELPNRGPIVLDQDGRHQHQHRY